MKITRSFCTLLILLIAGLISSSVLAQTEPVKPSILTGEVTSIDNATMVLQTSKGPVKIGLSDKTEYKRVSAENPSLKAATASTLSDISSGDSVVVSAIPSDEPSMLQARTVYLRTKADLAEKEAKDKASWAAGVTGRVASVDPNTGQIKVEVRGLMNSTTVVVTAKPDAQFKRYASNSVKFSDAKVSSISEIEAGDGLRARGDRSPDGASFMADEIVSGGFRTIAGDIKSIDTTKNEIVITEEQSKKDITVELGSAVLMKKFPAEIAQRMASVQGGQGGPGGPGMRPAGGPPSGAAPAGNRPAGGGPGGPRGTIDEMLDRFPSITAADLKVGEKIAIVTSKNGQADRMTAFKLLAGIEPFVQLALARAAAGGQRGGQGTLSLDIPGLDGFSGP